MSLDRRDLLSVGGVLLAAGASAPGARAGEASPPARPIFDIHAHVSAAPGRSAGGYDIAKDLAIRKATMQRWGIRNTVLMAPYLYDQPQGLPDTARQNDFVAWYRDTHRDLFPVGLGVVQPNQGLEGGLAEMRRIKAELKLDGLVFHHEYTGSGIAGGRMVRFCKEAASLKLPVFIYVLIPGTAESGTALGQLARQVPEATFVALGGFSGHEVTGELTAVAKACANVMFDTSYCYPMQDYVADFVKLCGSERIFFGSDMSSEDDRYVYPNGYYDIIYGASLTDADRDNILWKNAHRLFGLA